MMNRVDSIDHIKVVAEQFWTTRVQHRSYIRSQSFETYDQLQKHLAGIALQFSELRKFERYLLYSLAYFAEIGWQRYDSLNYSDAERYALSADMLVNSLTNSHANFGLTTRDIPAVEIIADICRVLGQDDLSALSKEPKYLEGEVVRPRVIAALYQLGTYLFLHRFRSVPNLPVPNGERDKMHFFRFYVSEVLTHHIVTNNSLQVEMLIPKVDGAFTKAITALIMQPIYSWFQYNRSFLIETFGTVPIPSMPSVTLTDSPLRKSIVSKHSELALYLDTFPLIDNDSLMNELSANIKTDKTPIPHVMISHHNNERDDKWRRELRKQLGVFNLRGQLTIWDTTDIPSGSLSQEVVETNIRRADAAIILVSADYLNDVGLREMLQNLYERAKRGSLILLWVLVRDCQYKGESFAELQPLYPIPPPLEHLNEAQRDAALNNIVDNIAITLNIKHSN